MATLKDKNLFFYSLQPNDESSREFLKELEKNQVLKRQFILVCVNDPNIRIPEKILKIGQVPILVVPGLNRPILGNDAVSWLRNNSFQEKGNGFDYGSLDSNTPANFAFIGDESKSSDYNQYFNNEYNHGFIEKDSVLNQQFSTFIDRCSYYDL